MLTAHNTNGKAQDEGLSAEDWNQIAQFPRGNIIPGDLPQGPPRLRLGATVRRVWGRHTFQAKMWTSPTWN